MEDLEDMEVNKIKLGQCWVTLKCIRIAVVQYSFDSKGIGNYSIQKYF